MVDAALRSNFVKGFQIFKDRKIATHVPYLRPCANGVLKTKDGYYVATLKLNGISRETADISFLNQLQASRNEAFRSLSQIGSFSLYTHVVRRRVQPRLMGEFESDFARMLDDAYQRHITSGTSFVNDIYVSAIIRPVVSRRSGAGKLRALLGGKMDRLGGEAALVAKLEEAMRNLMSSLKVYGPKRLMDVERGDGVWYSEQCEFIYQLLNGLGRRPFRLSTLQLDEVLPARRTTIGNRIVRLETLSSRDERYGAVISMKEYPQATASGMFDELLHINQEMIVTQSFSFVDDAIIRERIDRLNRTMSRSAESDTSVQTMLFNARDSLAKKDVAYAEHHMTIMPLAPTVDKLEDAVADVAAALGQVGVGYVREDFNLEPAYWAQLPGNNSHIARKATISTANLAGMSSFHNYPYGKPDGNHWGQAISVLQTTSGTPFFFNFHEVDVGHTTIVGRTGTGKTVLLGFLLAQSERISPRRKAVVYDKDRGAEIAVRAMGGRYFLLEPGEPSGFNPFTMENTPTNRAFLMRLLSYVLAPAGQKGLTAQEETILANAIERMMNVPNPEARRLRFLKPLLEGQQAMDQGLSQRLDRWIFDGANAWVFDNERDELDFSKSLTGFDMTHVLDDPVVRTAALMYLFERQDDIFDGNPVMIMLDEGWKLLDDDVFAAAAKDWFKTIRKRNGIVVIGTQSASDISEAKAGRTIIQQSVTNIFFPDRKADEKSYRRDFGLSIAEFDFIQRTDPNKRLMLIKHSTDAVIARLDLSFMPEYVKVLSGRTGAHGTIAECERLRERLGDEPAKWLPEFMGVVPPELVAELEEADDDR
jgi:type IV secretion system protein VirB4